MVDPARRRRRTCALYTYPDALVHCGAEFEGAKQTTLLDPRVIVEVLAESTEGYDRGEKFRHYRAIPSVAEYVLVSTTARRIEVLVRRESTWVLSIHEAGDVVTLTSIDVPLSVDPIYEGVDLDPVRSPPIER